MAYNSPSAARVALAEMRRRQRQDLLNAGLAGAQQLTGALHTASSDSLARAKAEREAARVAEETKYQRGRDAAGDARLAAQDARQAGLDAETQRRTALEERTKLLTQQQVDAKPVVDDIGARLARNSLGDLDADVMKRTAGQDMGDIEEQVAAAARARVRGVAPLVPGDRLSAALATAERDEKERLAKEKRELSDKKAKEALERGDKDRDYGLRAAGQKDERARGWAGLSMREKELEEAREARKATADLKAKENAKPDDKVVAQAVKFAGAGKSLDALERQFDAYDKGNVGPTSGPIVGPTRNLVGKVWEDPERKKFLATAAETGAQLFNLLRADAPTGSEAAKIEPIEFLETDTPAELRGKLEIVRRLLDERQALLQTSQTALGRDAAPLKTIAGTKDKKVHEMTDDELQAIVNGG